MKHTDLVMFFSALTHARAKLLPSAFVELNQTALLPHLYSAHPQLVERWQGHRLMAVDSSLSRLRDGLSALRCLVKYSLLD